MPHIFVKIGKSGIPYFNEFDTDHFEKLLIFTRITRHDKSSGWAYFLFELKNRKSMTSVKWSISDISLVKNLSTGSPDLLTTVICEKSLTNSQM